MGRLDPPRPPVGQEKRAGPASPSPARGASGEPPPRTTNTPVDQGEDSNRTTTTGDQVRHYVTGTQEI
jgi:hypothetical protein